MNNLNEFIEFLEKLEDKKIYYRLNKTRNDTVMVEVAVPGQRWEIEYNTYGESSGGVLEIEKFLSNGTIYDEKYLEKLEQLKSLCEDKDERNLLISYDKIHRDEGERLLGAEKYQENIKKLTESKLFRDFAMSCDVSVIHDGRAKTMKNKQGLVVIPQCEELKRTPYFQYEKTDSYSATLISMLSVSALGDVSLESESEGQMKKSWGNILERDLDEIIESSSMTIKCASLDEYNDVIMSRNKKLQAMQMYANMKRLKMDPNDPKNIDKIT